MTYSLNITGSNYASDAMVTHHKPSSIFKIIGLSFGLALLVFSTSHAHDYWYELDGQDYVLYRGHHHIKHEGEEIVPYDPKIVKNIYCASQDGGVHTIAPPTQYPARIPGPCAVLTVEVDSGYWSQTWTAEVNQSKDLVSDAVFSWRAIESTKLLNSWEHDHVGHPLSQGLEFVLERNPFVLQNGEKLRLRVTQSGKPREGVTVAYDGKPRGVTGKDGRINIRIRHGGLQIITGSIDEPPFDKNKAEKLVRATALFFELPENN